MASEDDAMTWTWTALEPPPTDQERALYDLFCQEFMIDGDRTLAASRCGFQTAFAAEFGERIYQKSYVQRRLGVMRAAPAISKEHVEYDHTVSINVLRQVATNAREKGSARVNAVRALAAIRGFNAPVKSSMDVNARGGVIMVPGIANLEAWEAAAQNSQQALADASRVT